jgi:hypothetical protein
MLNSVETMSKRILTILKEIKAIHEKVVPVQVKKDKIRPANKYEE